MNTIPVSPPPEKERDPKKEGWTWVRGSRKWHYFREGRAICSGFLLFVHPPEGYELDNDDSSDNCAACKKKRMGAIVNAGNAP
jgi:hypothetical protein